jgi:hypothetical protein
VSNYSLGEQELYSSPLTARCCGLFEVRGGGDPTGGMTDRVRMPCSTLGCILVEIASTPVGAPVIRNSGHVIIRGISRMLHFKDYISLSGRRRRNFD